MFSTLVMHKTSVSLCSQLTWMNIRVRIAKSEFEDDGVSSSTEFQWLGYLSDKDSEEDRVNLRAERLLS